MRPLQSQIVLFAKRLMFGGGGGVGSANAKKDFSLLFVEIKR